MLRSKRNPMWFVVLIAFLFIFLQSPTSVDFLQTDTLELSRTENTPSAADNLIQVSLPISPFRIVVGNTEGLRGFAYYDDDEDKLYFIDPIQDTTLTLSLPSGDIIGTSSSLAFIGADIDGDNDTEFLLINDNSTANVLLVADFNDGSVKEIDTSVSWPHQMITGDFDGDSNLDVAIHSNQDFTVVTIDLQSSSIMGTFVATAELGYIDAGRFVNSNEDSIVLGSGPREPGNISIVDGNGTLVQSIAHDVIMGLTMFQYSDGLDEVAVTDSFGNLTVFYGSNLTEVYESALGLSSSRPIFVSPGVFNHDNQNDLAVISSDFDTVTFVDGTNGVILRSTEAIVRTINNRQFDLGYIDSDNLTDVTAQLIFPPYNPFFIHGADAEIGYIEDRIAMGPGSSQNLVIDLNNDGRDDIVTTIGGEVSVILSDVDPPSINPRPISPLHPTVIDDFVTVEVGVIESTYVKNASFYLRLASISTWTEPQEMLATGTGDKYFVFLVGLEATDYEYFYTLEDAYLNTRSHGNDTHPISFSVTGHFAWAKDKSNASNRANMHLFDAGNTSSGDTVLYALHKELTSTTAFMEQYSIFGDLLSSTPIPFGLSSWGFSLYTGMMDDDNVQDPVVMMNNASGVALYVFHGTNQSLRYVSTYTGAPKIIGFTSLFDDDGDGQDEFHFVEDTNLALVRMESDGVFSNASLAATELPQFAGIANTGGDLTSQFCLITNYTRIDIYNASSLSLVNSHNISLDGYTKARPVSPLAFHNASRSTEQFIVGFTFWNDTDPSARFYIFDMQTANLSDALFDTIPNLPLAAAFAYDVDRDQTDELYILSGSGELSLNTVLDSLSPVWTVGISDSTPLGFHIADFDGEGGSELLVFTKQDRRLTAVSFDGTVLRSLVVGQIYNPISIGNVDAGGGEEVAAFPIFEEDAISLGAIRDLDWYYRVNVSVVYEFTELQQSDVFNVTARLENIYNETFDDASVLMTAHFERSGSPDEHTFGFLYDSNSSEYQAGPTANWPIGQINLSLSVEHPYYHSMSAFYANAITVRSVLEISVSTQEIAFQGGNVSVEVTVADSFGTLIPNANVTITLGGVNYTATYSDSFYGLKVLGIQLSPGIHDISVEAVHAFSSGKATETVEFRMYAVALLVAEGVPDLIEYGNLLSGWLNITDPYGNPIDNATVSVVSGVNEFLLSDIGGGSYFLNTTISIPIGNYSFDIVVDHPYLQGQSFGEFFIAVEGDLFPEVDFTSQVTGGGNITVSVAVYDILDEIPNGVWVTIEIDGMNFTAIHHAGAVYRAEVNASYSIGEYDFVVYFGSEFGHPRFIDFSFIVKSEPELTLTSSLGWSFNQGESTIISMILEDWLHTPVIGATISIIVHGTTYLLEPQSAGNYSADVSTSGWEYGHYIYTMNITHPYLFDTESSGNLTIVAIPVITITPSTIEPEQQSMLIVEVDVKDSFGYQMEAMSVEVTFAGQQETAVETDVGTYVASFDVGDTRHGNHSITVSVAGETSIAAEATESVNVVVYIPEFEMEPSSLAIGGGLSLLISLIGMILYFRVASSLTAITETDERFVKSTRTLDRVYIAVLAAGGLVFFHSLVSSSVQNYSLALAETVILLGVSVLLYGLWLYRDAYSSILLTDKISRRRIVLGLWHLFLVPLVVLQMFEFGRHIELFEVFILEVTFAAGPILIPTIMVTIFGTFASSIVIVVINVYIETRRGLKRIHQMEVAATPLQVIQEERYLLVKRVGSSIRMKFLLFLVLIGGTTIISLDFLRSVSLAVIILLPLVFLVVIPFISSRIVKGLPAVLDRLRRKKDDTSEESSS